MKNDYKKILKHLYAPKADVPGIVTVPKMQYLMVSGVGHPSDASFQSAAQTIFPIAYVSKFILKNNAPDKDFTVMPMEVKWKLDRNQHGSKRYYWTMMIFQPEYIEQDIIDEAIRILRQKKKDIPYSDRVRLQDYHEGLSGQIMHVGPFREPMEQTFDLLKKYLSENDYIWEPDSHDIYFNDLRRTPPEKLRTLIRVRICKKDHPEISSDDPFTDWK